MSIVHDFLYKEASQKTERLDDIKIKEVLLKEALYKDNITDITKKLQASADKLDVRGIFSLSDKIDRLILKINEAHDV